MRLESLCRGFTLLEILVALVLGALLLALATPSFTAFVRNGEVRSTAESIANGLRSARSLATRRNLPVSFTLTGGTDSSWAINLFDPATATLIQPPIETFSKLEIGRNTVAVPTPANAVAVTFDGLGRVISPSPIATSNIQYVSVNSASVSEARPLRVYADDVHGVRMCDPDAALKASNPTDARTC